MDIEQTKHKSIPLAETVDTRRILGQKVLTHDGKKIGKIKSIHIHPKELTVEGIKVDPGMFEPDHYIDNNYISSLTGMGAVLKVMPVTEYIGLTVYDSLGKKIGKVKDIRRSKLTNKLISIDVDAEGSKEDLVITADYISAIGESVMLKEPCETEKCKEFEEKR